MLPFCTVSNTQIPVKVCLKPLSIVWAKVVDHYMKPIIRGSGAIKRNTSTRYTEKGPEIIEKGMKPVQPERLSSSLSFPLEFEFRPVLIYLQPLV